MTAILTPRNTIAFGNEPLPLQTPYPIAATAVIPQGVMVAKNTAGYVVNASADPTLIVLGVTQAAAESLNNAGIYDNTLGGNGAFQVIVSQSAYWFANYGDVVQSSIGLPCYVQDNQTVSLTSNGGALPFAGTILGISSTYGVLVQFLVTSSSGAHSGGTPADKTFTFRAAFSAPGAGAQDVTLVAADALSIALRIVDVKAYVGTAASGVTGTLRDTAAGGGAVLSGAVRLVATGEALNDAATQTYVTTPSLTTGIFFRLSDGTSVVGEVVVTCIAA